MHLQQNRIREMPARAGVVNVEGQDIRTGVEGGAGFWGNGDEFVLVDVAGIVGDRDAVEKCFHVLVVID